MKFLDYLFHGKELRYIDSYFKMLNGYSPTFTSYNGGVYEMDLTRTAVNSFATHCSKLKPEIEGSALKSLEKTLQHKPNYFMDTTKFIKRLATYVAVEHTAFIIPIEDEYGRLCGWYPLRAQRCEVVEATGQVYLRYLFANGEHGAIEFERVGIMTDFEYTDDLFGEDNRTLKILKKEVLYEFDLQIECLNPFWREEEETKEDIASWVAAWHFPCVIEKDSTKSMIYGYRAESVIVDCYNEGDVSTGMRIRFTALGTVSNPILLNVDTEEFIQINATMKTGDVIEINTKYGSKGAKLIRDGVETDYFRYIDVDSTFMQLAIGDNMFRYDAASGVNSLEVSIFYSKEFLGV